MSERTDLLLALADDELVLGWRNSEWTGIAPFLEEDVAFSSIAQNEIGHARALYELAAAELGTTADELAFDRTPEEYHCAPLVELEDPIGEEAAVDAVRDEIGADGGEHEPGRVDRLAPLEREHTPPGGTRESGEDPADGSEHA